MSYTINGLQLYLNATGYSGNTSIWTDLSSNGNNGTLNNFSDNIANWWENDTLQFDGSNDYVSIPNSTSLNIDTGEITIEAYFMYLGGTSVALVSKDYTKSYHLSLDDTSINWWTNNSNLSANANLKGGSFCHLVCMVKTDGTKLIYLNNSLVASGTGSLATSLSDVFIGKSSLVQQFNGKIKTIRIYNRALTSFEIEQNYNDVTIGTNLAQGLSFTSNTTWSNSSFITNGDKSSSNNYADSSSSGLTWIQLDLGTIKCINSVNMWRYWADGRSYHDVIIQLSNDSSFTTGVTTIFNNDADNSVGFGIGIDSEYVETFFGKSISADNTNARYIRIYSNGSTANTSNHYVEVEVYGTNSQTANVIVASVMTNTIEAVIPTVTLEQNMVITSIVAINTSELSIPQISTGISYSVNAPPISNSLDILNPTINSQSNVNIQSIGFDSNIAINIPIISNVINSTIIPTVINSTINSIVPTISAIANTNINSIIINNNVTNNIPIISVVKNVNINSMVINSNISVKNPSIFTQRDTLINSIVANSAINSIAPVLSINTNINSIVSNCNLTAISSKINLTKNVNIICNVVNSNVLVKNNIYLNTFVKIDFRTMKVIQLPLQFSYIEYRYSNYNVIPLNSKYSFNSSVIEYLINEIQPNFSYKEVVVWQ